MEATGSLQLKGKIYYAVIRTKDINGKSKQKWINTKCEKEREANKVLRKLMSDIEEEKYVNPSKMLFSDFMIDWLENIMKPQIEQTTYEGYCTNIKVHIVPYFKEKGIRITDLKTFHLQNYFNEKYKNGRLDGKGGLSACFLKKHYNNILKALNYAIRIKLIKENPVVNVVLPKIEPYEAQYYSVEELERLLGIIKGTVIETPVFLTVHYGFRRGEVLGLKWSDIDFEDGTLTIHNQRTKVNHEVEKGVKTKSSIRTLPLIPNVTDYLKKLKVKQKENKLLLGSEYKDNDYVSKYADGTPTNITTLNHTLTKLLEKHNMKHIRFHDLRHSTASYLLKNGLSLKEIQEWLGHSDIKVTANLYAHVDIEMKRNTANKVNELFSKAK